MMEGGSLLQIMQPTALMIVLGGTVGAVMIQFPAADGSQGREESHCRIS